MSYRNYKYISVAIIALSAALYFSNVRTAGPVSLKNKVLVLGFDGADFGLTQKWIEEGKLPNLKKLKEGGSFHKLMPTNPSESPVSWSALITGSNPGKMGIFDFLSRDPLTYYPDFSTNSVKKGQFLFNIFPVKKPEVISNRGGKPFWNVASAEGVRSIILKAPICFPPDKMKNNETLAGLGVPDIRGTMGTFSYYASDISNEESGDTEMGGKIIKIRFIDGKIDTVIFGPRSPFEKGKSVMAPLSIEKLDGGKIKITAGGSEDIILPGKWSKWFTIKFKITPVVTISGTARFFLISGAPELRLYMSPININPENPILPLSNPGDFSAKLKEDIGVYKTLGWPTETWALNENRIDEDTYLEDFYFTFKEEEDLLFGQITRPDWQIMMMIFQGTDHIQHLFWRFTDDKHPLYDAEAAPKYKDAILNAYIKMDDIVGRAMKSIDNNTTLIILSDHGFNSFRKAVNINTYLVNKGYMSLSSEGKRNYSLEDLFGHGEFWPNVNWANTKAYALGLGQIYINLKGRERDGTIEKRDYDRTCDDIIASLKELKDPDTGEQVVKEVYKGRDIYSGPYMEKAPDLVVGFNNGYRVGWQSSLGGIPRDVISVNKRKWSGDHCSFDPSITEGIFLSNKKFNLPENMSVIDIAPTVLDIVSVKIPEEYDGHSFSAKN